MSDKITKQRNRLAGFARRLFSANLCCTPGRKAVGEGHGFCSLRVLGQVMRDFLPHLYGVVVLRDCLMLRFFSASCVAIAVIATKWSLAMVFASWASQHSCVT